MPKRLAVCIGVNKYRNAPSINLKFACNDAEAVASVLRDPSRGEFDSVIEVFDDEAKKANLLKAIESLLSDRKLTQDDLILIYFSGHGTLDKADNLSLIPHDVGFDSDGSVRVSTTVHVKEIEVLLENTRAGSVIVILDACHSGASGKLLGRIRYEDSSNVILVGAARYSEPAWETSEFEHGRFTQCLLSAINQRPTQGEWITLQQALAFIQLEMQRIDANQIMEVSSHAIDQNILLFKNPMYPVASQDFTDEVRELCQISNFTIAPTQLSQTIPNLFIIREQHGWGRYADTLIACLDNSVVEVVESHIEQFDIAVRSFQREGQVTSGMIITRRELPSLLKKSLHPTISARTIDEIQHSLINFDHYLRRLIKEFEEGSFESEGTPPPIQTYIELNAKVSDPEYKRRSIRKPITEVVNEWLKEDDQPSTIILGGYGTGKTTISRKIAYDLAKAYNSSPNKRGLRIPILFHMRRFPKFAIVDIEAFVIAHLKQYCKVTNPDFGSFQAMNAAGFFVLIFDGFDEMAVHANELTIQRNFDTIVQFAKVPKSKILMTSRSEVFLSAREEGEVLLLDDDSSPENFPVFRRVELQPFSREQIKSYLQKRIPLIRQVAETDKDWTYYRDRIDNIIGLHELCRRPVLLEMTIKTLPKLVQTEGVVTRPRLYETYLNDEIERQQRYKQRDFLIRSRKHRLSLIQTIARHLYIEGIFELKAEQIQGLLHAEFASIQQLDSEALTRDLIACSFLIREGDQYRFSHRSFMEYLVAKVLAQEIESQTPDILKRFKLTPAVRDFLVDLKPVADSTWRETLWTWIRSTVGQTRDKAMHVGCNAITLLNYMKESFARSDLRSTVLIRADLQEAQCQNARFSGSDLENVRFFQANLANANMTEAILRGADLSYATLTKVNFQNADLRRTIMWSTRYNSKRLAGSPLREHIRSSSLFKGANLEGAIYKEPTHPGCFPAGTRIKMSDGSEKYIENIQAEDKVLSYCFETNALVESSVVETREDEVSTIVVINGGDLVVTPSESVFTSEKWIQVNALKKGDSLFTLNGTTAIHSIENIQREIKIFHFKALPYHNFFAEGNLVHNPWIKEM